MSTKNYTGFYRHFYRNKQGFRRQYAIFAPGIDRFILIENEDVWMTLETAEILSSKLPTMVCMLPTNVAGMNNENCIEYTVFNKTIRKIGPSPVIAGRQQPTTKFIRDDEAITVSGFPEAYKDNPEIIERLLDYAWYVHKRVFAINYADMLFNIKNNARFVNNYIDKSWSKNLFLREDQYNDDEDSVLTKLKKILYLANDIEDAEIKIIALWKERSVDQSYLLSAYYRYLNEPVPTELEYLTQEKVQNLSTFLF